MEKNNKFKVDSIIEEVKVINENNDMFNSYEKALSICDFLELPENKKILEKNNLIALYGAWGTGKSCLMKTIEERIDKKKFETCWFDTWKYEKDDNLPYSLFKFIRKKCLKDSLVEGTATIGNYAYGMFKSLSKSVEVEAKFCDGVGLTVNPGQFLDNMEKIAEERDKLLESQMCLWEKIQCFEEEFKSMKVTKNKNKRLIVFLDDLDRCESDNIISLMFSIKLLLSLNSNIIFILGIDKNAITMALKNKYNNDINKAEEYLEKIFPITFELNNEIMLNNFVNYIEEMTELENKDDLYKVLEFFYKIDLKNARHIKKVFRKYYFIKEYLKSKGYDLKDKYVVILVLYNIILNIFYNEEYSRLIYEDSLKKYNDIVFEYLSPGGKKIKLTIKEIKVKGSLTYDGDYLHDIFDLWLRFSSYEYRKNIISCNNIVGNIVYLNYVSWKEIFKDNICKDFLDFVIEDNEFLKFFRNGTNFYDKKFVYDFIYNISKIL